ncbi:xanthine/uracil permease family protein [Niallia circulans]|jgi:adenine/guanine/hypoxanthine permease|uniref:NCS2 family permease n=1 Tax=Shouchella clausii TaxID=79880 RepID=UPI000BA55E1D|nr:NCS2 family permease [Shouchella clausii]PAF12276.1 permease [Shouchella clausii]SPU21955.1 xanthine/uracil permease family protein [Niallia circulans]
MNRLLSFFQLHKHDTTMKQELGAGTVAFLTSVYIVAINSSILADAGMPVAGAAFATILTCFFGCLLMGVWSNTPIVLIPGMGINAMFAYTFVHGVGMSWQEALAVVFVAGVLFVVISFTRFATILDRGIPADLKHGITAGIGCFLMFIGLQKGGIVEHSRETMVQLANLSEPLPLATLLTLVVALFLFVRGISGHFLWAILCGIGIGLVLNVPNVKDTITFSTEGIMAVFGQLSFSAIATVPFWTSVFAMTMVLTFENIGLISGYTKQLGRPDKGKRALQANAISALASGVFGSSPTVSTAETAAGLAAGGKTGVSAITTGMLFLFTFLLFPLLVHIPDSAIAPILIIVGALMMKEVREISFADISDWLPAMFIVIGIPFTYSIADGIAFGFVAYSLLKTIVQQHRQVSTTMYVVGVLFFLHLLLSNLG